MRKLLKWVAIALGAAVLVLVAGGFLMPRTIEVSRSATMAATPDKIYPHLVDLRAFSRWSPWSDMDPAMQVIFTGPDSGPGQSMAWLSEKMGDGSQTITAAEENRKVVSALDFGPMGTAEAQFLLAPDGPSTQVTWTLVTDLGNNPLARWFGPMLRSGITKDYDRGLEKLRATVEGT